MYPYIPEIMTFKECQQFLKIGKNTLLDLIHNREIDAFKIGNRWKIPNESVVEFIRNHVNFS
jgi:excisionase family DNA binding protein